MMQAISPIDGRVCAEFALSSTRDIDQVLDKGTRAFGEWKRMPLHERTAICLRMVDWMVERADDIGAETTCQMGRPIAHSPLEIRGGFQERARHMIDIAGDALTDVETSPAPGFRRFIRHEPLGLVFVIAPWNYPYLTSVNAVVPALVAGNSVLLKVSQQTPLVATRYAEAFAQAGLPDGVFQYVHTDHDGVSQIIADPRVAFVSFTGSVDGGHAVQRAAAARFIGANLELGGKDPAYVRADAPFEATVENLVDGAFFNAGQSCCAVERIYVHEDLFPRFVDAFVDLSRKYRLGNPLLPETTLGPMVRAAAAEGVRQQVRDAVHEGARALVDPREFPADRQGTPYMAPQVLVNVNHGMRIMTEETFGPAVGIMAVKNDDEAVGLMNDSRYGLTASIWTADLDAALHIGDRVDTGTWFQNRCDYLDPALAWSGVRDSGRGCSLSRLGYAALTRPKSFHLRTDLSRGHLL